MLQLSRFIIRPSVAAVVVVAFAFEISTHAQDASALAISAREDAVTVSNVTPGGDVLLFACVRTARYGRAHVERHAFTIKDDDRDGIAVHRPGEPIPALSAWVAVDMKSGAVAAGTPSPRSLYVEELSEKSLKRDSAGQIGGIERDMRRALVLVARPGEGAWTLAARDGAEADDDRTRNARIALSFASARSIDGKRHAPKYLKAGDVVVVIDPVLLDVRIATVVK